MASNIATVSLDVEPLQQAQPLMRYNVKAQPGKEDGHRKKLLAHAL
jgi:hypothetical protein